jgi:hypothetical protein
MWKTCQHSQLGTKKIGFPGSILLYGRGLDVADRKHQRETDIYSRHTRAATPIRIDFLLSGGPSGEEVASKINHILRICVLIVTGSEHTCSFFPCVDDIREFGLEGGTSHQEAIDVLLARWK